MTERTRPTEVGNEWDTLTEMLDFLRATVVVKATGVSDEEARRPNLPPTELSLANVVKHLTGTERFWFSIDFAGSDVEWPWPDDDPHGNFIVEDHETIESLIAEYEAECERSRQAIAGESLDAMARGDDMHFNLRYALTHMIEETARHAGHMDILREHIDGQTGQ